MICLLADLVQLFLNLIELLGCLDLMPDNLKENLNGIGRNSTVKRGSPRLVLVRSIAHFTQVSHAPL
jgi:hypothetical protein